MAREPIRLPTRYRTPGLCRRGGAVNRGAKKHRSGVSHGKRARGATRTATAQMSPLLLSPWPSSEHNAQCCVARVWQHSRRQDNLNSTALARYWSNQLPQCPVLVKH